LFRRHAPLVRGIGRRILRDDGEAEDLVQEVFLYLHDKAGVFDSSKSSARSWIVQVVYYRAIARRRYLSSRHCQDRLAQECLSVETPIPEAGDGSRSEEALFSSAVVSEVWQTLTEAQRETLQLFFFEGYTLSEISAKLSQPAGNIRHHYYRGLERLRARLSAK
jgi:RNA polymerase sigma-70 factor (ECF subfamily)